MGNKRKDKEVESDGPNDSQEEAKSVKRWENVKTQVALLPRWPRQKNAKK